ncbi:MAG: ABC transporter substrate-binding protein, partial [Candidatus Hodarchaeales archaeon]
LGRYVDVLRNQPDNFGFGTGPYRFKEIHSESDIDTLFSEGDYVILEAVDNYWNGNVSTNEIILLELHDRNQALTGIQNGNVHLVTNSISLSYGEVRDKENIEFIPGNEWTSQAIVVNMNHPILGTGEETPLGQSNPSRAKKAAQYIRQAISYAVPRQKIVDEIYNGYASPGIGGMMGMVPAPATFGFDESLEPYNYNLTKARDFLEKAWLLTPNEITTTIESTTATSSTDATTTSSFLLAMLALATIVVNVKKGRKSR